MTRLLTALIALLVFAVPAVANQQKVSISTIEHNSRTGLLEVVHRIPSTMQSMRCEPKAKILQIS